MEGKIYGSFASLYQKAGTNCFNIQRS